MNARYVQFRSYCQRIDNTPYRLIIKLKPTISKLHVLGSVCYPCNQNAKELDAGSRKGYFVGYDRKVHRILFITPKMIGKHRVVKFTDKSEMSSALINERGLFTDNNEIGTP